MSKQPVHPEWFNFIPGGASRDSFAWLEPLSDSVGRIANFGCWSNEPFALLWILDVNEVAVIEKDTRQLDKEDGPRDNLEFLKNYVPASLQGRTVKFIVADMTSEVPGLLANYFDLAFCENVLYFMGDDLSLAQRAINEMARVVKPGGWVIAVEPKFGASFEDIPINIPGVSLSIPGRVSDPKDISSLFEATDLIRSTIEDAPQWSYCYQKSIYR